MSSELTVPARIYRETVQSYNGADVTREEIVHQATASVMNEIRAGRYTLDIEAAVRRELIRADESDGKIGDRYISRAARGEVPLVEDDMDVVVTLGGGRRKCWRDVETQDLIQMREIRFRNYQSVRDAFQEFAADLEAVLPVVREHGTFGAAVAAGGFPPAEVRFEGAVA